jgi:tetratricopeptide (TPR) repeat protein
MLGNIDPAIADFDHAMKALRNIPEIKYDMLSERCRAATIAGLLDSAAESCDGSIALRSDSENEYIYESRGLLDLKLAKWDQAIADYTKLLYYRPQHTIAFYGRSLARRAKGDTTGADADAAQATRGEPHVAEIMARLGPGIAMTTKSK